MLKFFSSPEFELNIGLNTEPILQTPTEIPTMIQLSEKMDVRAAGTIEVIQHTV